MIKLNITQSGHEIYQDIKVKSSRSLKRLLERQKLSLLGLNYDIRVDDVGVTASLRSQDSMIKILEPILLVLHKTVRYILNAIYAGCSFHKAMYMSQKTIGKLCGIGPDQAHRIIQLLWKLGFFIKRRRYHTPGSPWLSCQYKMPKWLFKSKIRNYFSSVLPALGDKIRWQSELCPMHVSAKPMILTSYSQVVAYEEILACPREAINDNLPHVDPPWYRNIPKSEKELQNPLKLQHQLPLVITKQEFQQGQSMQLGMSRSLPMFTFVESETRRGSYTKETYLERLQRENEEALQHEKKILERFSYAPPVAAAPPAKKKSPELAAMQQQYLTLLDAINKMRSGKLPTDRLEELETRKITLKAEIEILKLKETNGKNE